MKVVIDIDLRRKSLYDGCKWRFVKNNKSVHLDDLTKEEKQSVGFAARTILGDIEHGMDWMRECEEDMNAI